MLSSFLARSLRRTLHAHHESQLVKAIAASENLAVAERTWAVLREEGAILEDAASDDEDGDGDGADEKGLAAHVGAALQLDEKAGLHRANGAVENVVDFT